MVKHLTPVDHVRIGEAIAAARRRTHVDIRLVSMHASSHYGGFAMIHALLSSVIAGLAASLFFPALDVRYMVALQVVIALIALLCLQSHWLRIQLVPDSSLLKAAQRRARLAYAELQLHATHGHPSVLLFCSAAERYAEILVDGRIKERVDGSQWDRIMAEFLPHMKQGDPASGLVHLVERTAGVLEGSFGKD